MLTSIDLQEIGKLIDERLDQKLEPIQKELKSHGKMLHSLKKYQSIMLNMLDREQMTQRKRLDTVEDRLGIHTAL